MNLRPTTGRPEQLLRIIDLASFPKDVYYMYQSRWRPDKQVLHLFPHWNWTEGKDVDLWVYANRASEVELFLNGHYPSSGNLYTDQPERCAGQRGSQKFNRLIHFRKLSDLL